MSLIRTQLEIISLLDSPLAPYAVQNSQSQGREFSEPADRRLPFQRDKDRIIHSKAFRRLKLKTQVFVSGRGDHFRDRLTHSLEVSQISRGLARSLGLNEDLTEAVALAHDLGHTPFGHAGEEALNEMMAQFGRQFKHNQQSKRIVEKLEKKYPDFEGLNLTWEVRNGLMKHDTPWEKGTSLPHTFHLEAQIANVADEIAYIGHDIDDGIRAGIIKIADFKKTNFGQEIRSKVKQRYPNPDLSPKILIQQIQRLTVNSLVDDILKTAGLNLEKFKIQSLSDVLNLSQPLIAFSPGQTEKNKEIHNFLHKNFYQHPQVIEAQTKGQEIIKKLFNYYLNQPEQLPAGYQKHINNPEPVEIIIKDYVAGMTDNFARQL
ncbi:MAG TPA: deoxyguanosinetriphosphate triphosphohydrolase, partial [Patescibacteria group bacterium]